MSRSRATLGVTWLTAVPRDLMQLRQWCYNLKLIPGAGYVQVAAT